MVKPDRSEETMMADARAFNPYIRSKKKNLIPISFLK